MEYIIGLLSIIMGLSGIYLHYIAKDSDPQVRRRSIRVGFILVAIGIGIIVLATILQTVLGTE